MIQSFSGKKPLIDDNAWVAKSAAVIGDVKLAPSASIWFNAVVRADIAPIVIGEGSNVQDNATLHVDLGMPCIIGKNVTIGHNAVVHSATVGDGALIGMNATVLNGAVIGEGAVIGAGALIPERAVVPPLAVTVGVPAKQIKTLPNAQAALENAEHYKTLAAEFAREGF